MSKTPTIIGHSPCPICPNTNAEVRLDRNELAYIYCANGCYTQVFTRDKHRDGLLRARMRPMAAAVQATLDPAPGPTPPAPGTVPLPTARPAPTPPAPPVPPVPPTKPSPTPATWLTTLLDGKTK
jgi:hypothetical protein